MLRPALYLSSLIFVLVASAAHPDAQSPSATTFFDDRVLHTVQLLVNSRDFKLLRERYQDNTYYPADMIWGDVRVRNVAIRSRGTGSRNPWKLGLKVDFNRYVSGRTFAGLNALVMDNLWQDPALIREKIAMSLLARQGQPAPREAFCRFYINGEYQGLYAMVEPIDAAFLKRAFSDSTGYLFEYKWVDYFYGQYLGEKFSPYKSRFQAQTHDSEPDAVLYQPIRDFFFQVNLPIDSVWRQNVERYVDLSELMKLVAVEVFTADIDGLLGAWGMDNFYMYRPAGSTRHRFLPWDKDVAFAEIRSSVTQRVDENMLIGRAMGFDDLRRLYFDELERCANAASQDQWLLDEIDRTWTLVSAAARADQKKQFSNDALEEGIAFLREFARDRSAFVLSEIAARRLADR